MHGRYGHSDRRPSLQAFSVASRRLYDFGGIRAGPDTAETRGIVLVKESRSSPVLLALAAGRDEYRFYRASLLTMFVYTICHGHCDVVNYRKLPGEWSGKTARVGMTFHCGPTGRSSGEIVLHRVHFTVDLFSHFDLDYTRASFL